MTMRLMLILILPAVVSCVSVPSRVADTSEPLQLNPYSPQRFISVPVDSCVRAVADLHDTTGEYLGILFDTSICGPGDIEFSECRYEFTAPDSTNSTKITPLDDLGKDLYVYRLFLNGKKVKMMGIRFN